MHGSEGQVILTVAKILLLKHCFMVFLDNGTERYYFLIMNNILLVEVITLNNCQPLQRSLWFRFGSAVVQM